MKFVYEKQDISTLRRAEETCWLLTNGLGGYMSASAAFSVTRREHGLLVAAEDTASHRFSLVHRLSERLTMGEKTAWLSAQAFADGRPPENGDRFLTRFTFDGYPQWDYVAGPVRVRRRCSMAHEENASAVLYDIENLGNSMCILRVTPYLQFFPKGDTSQKKPNLRWEHGSVTAGGQVLYLHTNGRMAESPLAWESLAYPDDARDGRPSFGYAGSCCTVEFSVPAGGRASFELIFSTAPAARSGMDILTAAEARREALIGTAGLRDQMARQLVLAADAFVARRGGAEGATIIAGYPFFGDWGRDTMVALPGCVLTTGRYDTAKSILRTFLAYEKDGLVPNLFPENGSEPQYNTVDAALLLIDCVWLYYRRTGDGAFVWEAWPVMERIIRAYRTGTRHAIGMDADGLIHAGAGLDQVTWMDVCVDGVLPTPRHGKPVEINAYWYNALRILQSLAPVAGTPGEDYGALAELVRESFLKAFWMEDKGCLRDVVSGTAADEQIRCNQIWAVTMPFTMLSREQEKRVVDTVYRHLWTPRGLRTLSPEDPEFHPFYGGPQKDRDMAYHQGTVWPFPLGAWYRAYLKVHDNSPEAAAQVRLWLAPMEEILREGCAGQLPEIYDGLDPGPSKGCFAQAWSVGELLRVYEALERIETGGSLNQERSGTYA